MLAKEPERRYQLDEDHRSTDIRNRLSAETVMKHISPRRAVSLLVVVLAAFLTLQSTPASAQAVGEVLPPWSPGILDIHQINTGRGDAAFFIFPDGTTMLVDAGDWGRQVPRRTLPRPDGARTPGEWIARYIGHRLSHESRPGPGLRLYNPLSRRPHGLSLLGLSDVQIGSVQAHRFHGSW